MLVNARANCACRNLHTVVTIRSFRIPPTLSPQTWTSVHSGTATGDRPGGTVHAAVDEQRKRAGNGAAEARDTRARHNDA